MDIERSFTFPFEDREWPSKLGLGAIISMVPILNFAWSGYLVGILRNVMKNDPQPLPTWDDLGSKFSEGLILFGAGLVYALPILIALCLPLGISAASGLLSGNSNMQDIGQTLTGAGGVLFFCMLGVLLLYGLVLSILYPAILVLFAREGTFASCFKLREAFELISKKCRTLLHSLGSKPCCQSWRRLARWICQHGGGFRPLHWLDHWAGAVSGIRSVRDCRVCTPVWPFR